MKYLCLNILLVVNNRRCCSFVSFSCLFLFGLDPKKPDLYPQHHRHLKLNPTTLHQNLAQMHFRRGCCFKQLPKSILIFSPFSFFCHLQDVYVMWFGREHMYKMKIKINVEYPRLAAIFITQVR